MSLTVLFLCTGNSCRSQMAEGWARHLRPDDLEPYSAGTRPQRLDLDAVLVMREAGVDISSCRPKHVDELESVDFDVVVTVCDHADEQCPVFPASTIVRHSGFDDPPKLAAGASRQEALQHYRRVRDEIRELVANLDEGPSKAR
ncbi:MAG TPA: arsenate reductase ArsC, partial [Acidobacteriota bacterium]|nr:arsenate reductase ArsC [Acidobacteriota bacterium]